MRVSVGNDFDIVSDTVLDDLHLPESTQYRSGHASHTAAYFRLKAASPRKVERTRQEPWIERSAVVECVLAPGRTHVDKSIP